MAMRVQCVYKISDGRRRKGVMAISGAEARFVADSGKRLHTSRWVPTRPRSISIAVSYIVSVYEHHAGD